MNNKLACQSMLTQLLMIENRSPEQQTAAEVLAKEYDKLRGLKNNGIE